MRLTRTCFTTVLLCVFVSPVLSEDAKTTETYARIKANIDSVSAINTHDHLMAFDQIGHRNRTERGEGMTLRSIWAGSYFTWIHPLEPWPEDGSFDTWWSKAQHNFANAKATSFYRYLLPAFRDLYGVDFDRIGPKQARELNDRIFEIEANPKTKFILFHGGFPWVGETGVIAMRFRNVWIDSCWLPTLSYTMAKRAYQEWLEVCPSNRIMWGSDTGTAEGIYGATEFTRQCIAEALAEKVIRGELAEKDALRIGRQIMRENALEVFPRLRERLWRE